MKISTVAKNLIGSCALAGVVLFSGALFAADPTLHEVYQAAQAGKLSEAQGMMKQVLRDHPNSAKAHYVEAELLAKEGANGKAKEELLTAERLEPGLPFAKPEAVSALKSHISGVSDHSNTSHQNFGQVSAGSNWTGFLILGIGLVLFIVLVSRWMARRNSMSNGYGRSQPSPGYGMPMQQPYGNGTPMNSSSGGMGSGIMSGLATGAAVGAGVVAGEALMHHFTDGSREHHSSSNIVENNSNDVSGDMGGNDFGISDNTSWDDNSISGNDDWS